MRKVHFYSIDGNVDGLALPPLGFLTVLDGFFEVHLCVLYSKFSDFFIGVWVTLTPMVVVRLSTLDVKLISNN